MRPWAALLASVVTALVAGCGEDEREPPPRPVEPITLSPETYGVNGHVLRALSAAGESALLERHLDEVEAGNLAFIRANVDWGQLEPRAPVGGVHAFDFAGADRWVSALAAHGIRWQAIGIGASTPSWAVSPSAAAAGCGGRAPPADPALVAEMMGAVAERYGRDGSFWEEHPELEALPVRDYEVWNEPNHGAFWCPAPDPARFADLFIAAAEAVRAVDPDANLITGGLAPFHDTVAASPGVAAKMDAAEFLTGMVEARPEMRQAASAIGVHTYGDPEGITSDLEWYRATLDGLGLGATPISLNEIGWPTSGTAAQAVAEGDRATYIAQLARTLVRSNCAVTAFAPHTWVTEEANPTDHEQWFGIAEPATGDPYPTARAYFDEVEAARRDRHVPAADVSAVC